MGCNDWFSWRWGSGFGDIAEAEDGLRLGVEVPEETADMPGSAGVDGGGCGPGGLSDRADVGNTG